MFVSSSPPEAAAGSTQAPLDLLIVGAGLSGIDLAHHVSEAFPSWRWEIHDTHDDLGGTWHTFRYPGIRSDSDMATFGFPFRQWPHKSTLGAGGDIKEYLRDTARECGAVDRLQLRSWIKNIDWISAENLYKITAVQAFGAVPAEPGHSSPEKVERTFWASRVHLASGYYSHDLGFRPDFPGEETFRGHIVHPQNWPEEMDYEGRHFVVIGSGATAITLVPALEALGAKVTMLQRSPSYVAPLPNTDRISALLKRLLPAGPAYRVARFAHGARDILQFLTAQYAPGIFTTALRAMQRRHLSEESIAEHFTPDYRPWDQRVCKAPDGDIFEAMNRGVEVVTDTIDTFTPEGIRVTSGQEIVADVVVTATGLELEAFGNATISIDGEELDIPSLVVYRGMMLSGVPNLSFTVGYINASWTLRADMVSRYMVTLWKTAELPYAPAPFTEPATRMLLDFEAGYIKRGGHRFPKQGETQPWRYIQNYLAEIPQFLLGNRRKAMFFGPEVAGVTHTPARTGTSGGTTDTASKENFRVTT